MAWNILDVSWGESLVRDVSAMDSCDAAFASQVVRGLKRGLRRPLIVGGGDVGQQRK